MEPSCSNQIAQIMLEGMQEVIGENDLKAFFRQTQYPTQRLTGTPGQAATLLPYRDLCSFQEVIEENFGLKSGRGILCRSGRASFKHLLPDFWKHLGITNLQYRLLPTPSRIKIGLKALAQVLSKIYGTEIQILDTGDSWNWRMEDCPYCYQRTSHGPVCDFAVGLLQEYLSWTTSGRFYMVEEIECAAAGGEACTIRIQKRPLD